VTAVRAAVMILRNAAVRHGRRTLASPISRSALHQLSTEKTATPTASTEAPFDSWPEEQKAHARDLASTVPKKERSSSRKQTKYIQTNVFGLGMNAAATRHQGRSWTREHQVGTETLNPEEQWQKFQRQQTETRKIGTHVEKRYSPTELLQNPPHAEDVTLELLMASQTHMGHHKSVWNPANARYIFGVREQTHIISLETTAAHLRRAARVVEETAYNGGLILFVGTRRGQMEIVAKAAELSKGCHVFTKWAPGTITNAEVMLRGHKLQMLDQNDKQLGGFQLFNDKPLMPDLVVCLNPLENWPLLYECGLKTIPTIGIIDTDADPTWVTYTIPANDDSLRSAAVIGGVLGRAGERGQQRRMEQAKLGHVTWNTPPRVYDFMSAQKGEALDKRKQVMGMTQQYHGLNDEEMKLLEKAEPVQKEVTEDAMLAMMGQMVDGQAQAKADIAEAIQQPVAELSAEDIEKSIQALASGTKEIEAALRSSGAASKRSAVTVDSIERDLAAVGVSAKEIESLLTASTAPKA